MAIGDILGVQILASGWEAEIEIDGLNTGGTYAFGFGANNVIEGANPKIVFTVTSLGYDNTGAATTIQRTVYGTKRVRLPYPDNASADETHTGSSVIVTVALSDYIYAKDKSGVGNSGTDVTVDILSGFYDEATTNNSASGFAVTNNSTAAYQKPVANWSWPGYQRITGTFDLRAVAFHRHGQSARPVRAVKFTVSDGTHEVTSTVTAPTIDADMSLDAVPVIEYVGSIDPTTLDQGAELTANFIAYPWVGDSGSLLDTSAGTAQPTGLPGPIKLLCDKSQTYGVTMALVDPVSGVDATGTAYDSAAFDEGTANPFLTISGAAEAIAAYNNTNHSRNDVGAGEIRLKAGSYSWLGATDTYGNKPKCWLTITHAASTNAAGVDISGKTGATNISDMVRLYRVTLTNATNSLFSGIDSIWFDQVICNTTGTGILTAGSVVYITHCDLTDMQLQPSGVANMQFALLRGCEFLASISRSATAHVMIGNLRGAKWVSAALFEMDKNSGSAAPVPIGILAYNKILGFSASGATSIFNAIDTSPSTDGQAIVQNIFEKVDAGPEALSNFISSESVTTNTPIDNVIVWHNTFTGGRDGYGYNSDGSTLKHRRFWSVKNNFFDLSGTKTDTFGTPDGARVGNWPIVWSVGASGNVHGNNEDLGAVGFDFEFSGLSTVDGSAVDSTWADFVDRKSYDGATEGDGLGDYTPNATSPLVGNPIDWILPFDIDGNERYLGDASGAITYGTPPGESTNVGYFTDRYFAPRYFPEVGAAGGGSGNGMLILNRRRR